MEAFHNGFEEWSSDSIRSSDASFLRDQAIRVESCPIALGEIYMTLSLGTESLGLLDIRQRCPLDFRRCNKRLQRHIDIGRKNSHRMRSHQTQVFHQTAVDLC